MQGAGKNQTRDIFRAMCQSFRSDNPTEQLLYLLHTAENRTDMEQIFALLQRQQQGEDESLGDLLSDPLPASAFELLCDKLWACTHCLLAQYSLVFQGKHHGHVTELEQVTQEVVEELGRLPTLPCQILSHLLLGQEMVAVERLRDITSEDEQRFQTHFLIVMEMIKELVEPYSCLPSPMPYQFHHHHHHQQQHHHAMIPYERSMKLYSTLLIQSGDVGLIVIYLFIY